MKTICALSLAQLLLAVTSCSNISYHSEAFASTRLFFSSICSLGVDPSTARTGVVPGSVASGTVSSKIFGHHTTDTTSPIAFLLSTKMFSPISGETTAYTTVAAFFTSSTVPTLPISSLRTTYLTSDPSSFASGSTPLPMLGRPIASSIYTYQTSSAVDPPTSPTELCRIILPRDNHPDGADGALLLVIRDPCNCSSWHPGIDTMIGILGDALTVFDTFMTWRYHHLVRGHCRMKSCMELNHTSALTSV